MFPDKELMKVSGTGFRAICFFRVCTMSLCAGTGKLPATFGQFIFAKQVLEITGA
jgi:hypothetical protein